MRKWLRRARADAFRWVAQGILPRARPEYVERLAYAKRRDRHDRSRVSRIVGARAFGFVTGPGGVVFATTSRGVFALRDDPSAIGGIRATRACLARGETLIG